MRLPAAGAVAAGSVVVAILAAAGSVVVAAILADLAAGTWAAAMRSDRSEPVVSVAMVISAAMAAATSITVLTAGSVATTMVCSLALRSALATPTDIAGLPGITSRGVPTPATRLQSAWQV